MSSLAAPAPTTAHGAEPHEVRIPALRELGLRAVPQVLEGAVIPVALFVTTMRLTSVVPAIIVAFAWEMFAIGRRLRRGRRVSGIMIVGALMLFARSTLALATGSTFVYFAQPIFGAACVAAAFLVSVAVGRPLARRFAGDFCVIPQHVHADARVHAYFQRCSLMWAAVGVANTAITLWLLLTQPAATFVLAKTALSVTLTVTAVAWSVVWFRRTVVRHGLVAAA
jgi:hypothetical protein